MQKPMFESDGKSQDEDIFTECKANGTKQLYEEQVCFVDFKRIELEKEDQTRRDDRAEHSQNAEWNCLLTKQVDEEDIATEREPTAQCSSTKLLYKEQVNIFNWLLDFEGIELEEEDQTRRDDRADHAQNTESNCLLTKQVDEKDIVIHSYKEYLLHKEESEVIILSKIYDCLMIFSHAPVLAQNTSIQFPFYV